MNTNNYKIIQLTVISILMWAIIGCTNSSTDANISTPYYHLSDEFTDYCWFDEGSYWVFQDDSTLVTDTVRVTGVLESKRFHNQQTAYNYEAVEISINSNSFDIAEYELTAGNFEVTPGEMNSLLRLYKSDGSYHLLFLPQFAFEEEVIMGDEIGTYTNIELLTTFEINNRTYNDVYHTRVVISVNNSVEYNYWVAKNHSLIKAVSEINGQTTSISLVNDNLINH